jgi:hypothetical protein
MKGDAADAPAEQHPILTSAAPKAEQHPKADWLSDSAPPPAAASDPQSGSHVPVAGGFQSSAYTALPDWMSDSRGGGGTKAASSGSKGGGGTTYGSQNDLTKPEWLHKTGPGLVNANRPEEIENTNIPAWMRREKKAEAVRGTFPAAFAVRCADLLLPPHVLVLCCTDSVNRR